MSNPTQPLQNQVSVVTGAGRGIGAAIAARLAGLGAIVVLCGRSRSRLDGDLRPEEISYSPGPPSVQNQA